jgi:hypothetical protein
MLGIHAELFKHCKTSAIALGAREVRRAKLRATTRQNGEYERVAMLFELLLATARATAFPSPSAELTTNRQRCRNRLPSQLAPAIAREAIELSQTFALACPQPCPLGDNSIEVLAGPALKLVR